MRKDMTWRQVHPSKGVFVSIWCGANVEDIGFYHEALLDELVAVKAPQNPGNSPRICGIKNHLPRMRLGPTARFILRSHRQLDCAA